MCEHCTETIQNYLLKLSFREKTHTVTVRLPADCNESIWLSTSRLTIITHSDCVQYGHTQTKTQVATDIFMINREVSIKCEDSIKVKLIFKSLH